MLRGDEKMSKLSKLTEEQVHYLEENLRDIDFGSIVITVHNGKITQIDTTEKKRFPQTAQQV